VIYELRIYTIKPGILPKYLDIVGNIGMKIRGNDYGKLVGTWTSEFGQLNEYYHLWEYPDPNERARLRAELAKVPAWSAEYLAATRGMVLAQRNTILTLDSDIGLRSVEGKGHIYEMRTYKSLAGGGINAWAGGFKRSLEQRETHSKLVALWMAEVGALNAATHLWVYDSLAHRTQVREGMAGDAKLRELRGNGAENLISQESVILNPTAFSPLA
jgi:hypothetical protein